MTMPDTPPTVTEHRKLPLPSADAGNQRGDITRIAVSIAMIDEAIEDVELLALALGN
ncbi:hypothetical protein ABMY26_06430 (plasmid) [Azospirillum sp. HJ39]|uniref:hypothetical protein n=1 Tax=Azospirillum sp. HJ39 TaxID=3159496 RepID=UPI003557AAE8